jgi:hypothetical protein
MMITHDQISQKAREIWEREGRPEGRDKEHWLQAEAELAQERRRTESRPSLGSEVGAVLHAGGAAHKENGARKRLGRRSK